MATKKGYRTWADLKACFVSCCEPLIGVVDEGGADDPVSGQPFFQSNKLIGLGDSQGRIQIVVDDIIQSNYGQNKTFDFDPITGEIDLSYNGSIWEEGSSLYIDLVCNCTDAGTGGGGSADCDCVVLKTNDLLNDSQLILNLVDSDTVLIQDLGGGDIQFECLCSDTGRPEFQTNDLVNDNQDILNLVDSDTVTVEYLLDGTVAFHAVPQESGGVDEIDWHILGNLGTVFGTNFLGTIDDVSLEFRTNNQRSGWIDVTSNQQTSFGRLALLVSTGSNNAAFGSNALRFNTTGGSNSAFGYKALYANTTGSPNSAFGFSALQSNTTGPNNSAFGYDALQGNTTGGYNTAAGSNALFANTTGSYNAAFGHGALSFNTTGFENTASGTFALTANVSGFYNTAHGYSALALNNGSYNTAVGDRAFYWNKTGASLVALGYQAGHWNSIGANNIFIGSNAALIQSVGLATELISGAGWTTVGWTGAGTTYTHTPGNTTALTNTLTSIANQGYALTYTITGRTAGTVTISFGDLFVTGGANVASQLTNLITFTSGILTITPSSDFDGTLTINSIKASFLSRASFSVIIGDNAKGYLGDDTNTIVIGSQAIGRGSNTTTIGNSSTISSKLFGVLNIGTTTDYADNAAALVGGLIIGDVYRTSDTLKIVH